MDFGDGNQLVRLDVPRSYASTNLHDPRCQRPGLESLGDLISIASVLFLGGIAWLKPDDPRWHLPALILGVATSIIGMGCRYKAFLDEQREIRKAQAEAERR